MKMVKQIPKMIFFPVRRPRLEGLLLHRPDCLCDVRVHLAQLASLLSRVPRRPENPDCSHLIHLQKIAEVVQHEQEADDRFELALSKAFTEVLNYYFPEDSYNHIELVIHSGNVCKTTVWI